MNTHADKTTETKSNAVANGAAVQQGAEHETFQLEDNRPEIIAQRKIQEAASNSEQVKQLQEIKTLANNSPQVKELRATQNMADGNTTNTTQLKEANENWHIEQPAQGRMKPDIQLMKTSSPNEKEGSKESSNQSWEHYYFNPGESSKEQYNTHIDNVFSQGLPVQMKPQKGWGGTYTSSLDTANPKKKFDSAEDVDAWEAALPAAPAAAAPAAAAPAAVQADDAQAAAEEPAAEAVPVFTVYKKMTRHYKDHKSNKLPKSDATLITYVTDNRNELNGEGDNRTMGLGDFQTKQPGGKWALRSWSIMVWEDNRIHHFGPLAQEF